MSISTCACSSFIIACASSALFISTAIAVPHDGQLCVVLARCTLCFDSAGSKRVCSSTDMSPLGRFYCVGSSAPYGGINSQCEQLAKVANATRRLRHFRPGFRTPAWYLSVPALACLSLTCRQRPSLKRRQTRAVKQGGTQISRVVAHVRSIPNLHAIKVVIICRVHRCRCVSSRP